jgi:hypothetical protein
MRKRKEADFPAETVSAPKDFEQGEGLPESIRKIIEGSLDKGKKRPED